MKRKPVVETKLLKRHADKLMSLYIRQRDGNRCVLCGSDSRPQCGHVLSRVALATRWDDTNCHCQCASCNMRHEFNAYPYISWFITKFGKDKLDELQRRWNKPHPMKRHDYEELIASLEAKIKALNERDFNANAS